MSNALTIPLAPEARPARARAATPGLLRTPFRVRVRYPRREPAWREAMRWSLIGLTASWAAAEATLLILGV
jgi:hypothetical protein